MKKKYLPLLFLIAFLTMLGFGIIIKHLPYRRQMIWRALAAILDRAVIGMAKKYKW